MRASHYELKERENVDHDSNPEFQTRADYIVLARRNACRVQMNFSLEAFKARGFANANNNAALNSARKGSFQPII
jgi:hypothetical protein